MKKAWYQRLAGWLEKRGRVKVITREDGSPYLIRYYIFFKDRPKWVPFNVYLHRTLRSDEDGLHDHPWPWASYILNGGYFEDTPEGRFWRGKGSFRIRKATDFHRLVLPSWINEQEQCWSLFFVGKRQKRWGFLNQDGVWVYWRDYLDQREKNA